MGGGVVPSVAKLVLCNAPKFAPAAADSNDSKQPIFNLSKGEDMSREEIKLQRKRLAQKARKQSMMIVDIPSSYSGRYTPKEYDEVTDSERFLWPVAYYNFEHPKVFYYRLKRILKNCIKDLENPSVSEIHEENKQKQVFYYKQEIKDYVKRIRKAGLYIRSKRK